MEADLVMKSLTKLVCRILILSVGSVCAICILENKSFAGENSQYNVVLIVGDAVRPDLLSCYGGDASTPNLEWLKKNGVIFNRAYSAAPWTSPSAVSIMTGNNATSYRTEPFRETVKVLVPDDEELLLEVLQQNGYLNRYNIENWNARIHNNLQGAEALNPDIRQANLSLSLEEIERQTGITQKEGADSTYSFLDFLLSVDVEQPFFAMKWFMDPHAPYNPSRQFRDRIILNGRHISDIDQYVNLSTSSVLLNKDKRQGVLNKELYKASIESLDERIGFILRALRERKLLDKTFVIFISDHGELFGEHGLWEHGGFGRNCTFYEELVRVPLLISGPTLPKGKVVYSAVSLIDLMPTIKQILGLNYPDGMQGKSLMGLINQDSHSERDLYFSNIVPNEQLDALIKNYYKLIVFKNGSYVLYDLSEDPGEKKDISRTKPNIVKDMLKLIATRREANSERIKTRPVTGRGFVPKSKGEEKEIIKQLRSLGYIK